MDAFSKNGKFKFTAVCLKCFSKRLRIIWMFSVFSYERHHANCSRKCFGKVQCQWFLMWSIFVNVRKSQAGEKVSFAQNGLVQVVNSVMFKLDQIKVFLSSSCVRNVVKDQKGGRGEGREGRMDWRGDWSEGTKTDFQQWVNLNEKVLNFRIWM